VESKCLKPCPFKTAESQGDCLVYSIDDQLRTLGTATLTNHRFDQPKAEWPLLLAIAVRRRPASHPHQRPLRLSSRRTPVPQRCPPSRLGIRRLPAAHAHSSNTSAWPLRRIARRPALLLRHSLNRWPSSSPASWPKNWAADASRKSPLHSQSRSRPCRCFNGTEFQYTSFDFLWWALIAYFVVRLLRTENPRWWLAIGATLGLGLLTKYSIVFYIAGILAGLVLTPARRSLKSIWFWSGIASRSRSSSFPTSFGSSATTSSPTTSSSTSTCAM
jgi:hypothetical protein